MRIVQIISVSEMMNENRMISWEEAEQIMITEGPSRAVKSSLPEQVRPTEPDNETDVDDCITRLTKNDPSLKEINLNNMKVSCKHAGAPPQTQGRLEAGGSAPRPRLQLRPKPLWGSGPHPTLHRSLVER